MESFQKRDRDRKKLQKRNERDARRKERSQRRKDARAPGNVSAPAESAPVAHPLPSAAEQGVPP